MRLFENFLFVLAMISAANVYALPPASLSLDDFLKRVQEQNVDIQAARQSWQVKRSAIDAAGVWPDPTLSYTNEKFPNGAPGAGTEKIDHYRIEQTIPFPGKLSKDAAMKYHEAQIAETQYRIQLIDTLNEARLQYFKLYLTDQNIQLAQASVEILRSALRVAQVRLGENRSNSGDHSISDVFMAQVELRKMENRLFEQQQQRLLIQIELNTLLNQPTDQLWGATSTPPLIDIPLTLVELEKLAARYSPLYQEALHEMSHSQAMASRARLNFAPDFGVMYELEKPAAGTAGRQIGASITLPLWFTRPLAESRSAQAHLIEAEAASQGMKNVVTKMVHREYVETTTHLQLSRNDQEGILPASESSVRIARRLYASDRGDFVRLIETVRGWIEANVDYQEQLYHYAEHWSELERWVGIDLRQSKETLEHLQMTPEEMHHDR